MHSFCRALLILLLPSTMWAQGDSLRALIEGRVIDPNGAAVEAAEIVWPKGGLSVLTRADGTFTLRVPRGAEVVIVARRPGFNAQALRIDVTTITNWRGTILLQPGSFRLPDVEVTARNAKPSQYGNTAKYDDFFRRQRLGLGTFVTREQIEKMNVMHTIEIFRGMPGVRADVHPLITAQSIAFARCHPNDWSYNVSVWIDGQRLFPEGGGIASPTAVAEMIARVGPTGIEMIEVYRGAGQIPGEFHTDGCAAIVIWTRHNR